MTFKVDALTWDKLPVDLPVENRKKKLIKIDESRFVLTSGEHACMYDLKEGSRVDYPPSERWLNRVAIVGSRDRRDFTLIALSTRRYSLFQSSTQTWRELESISILPPEANPFDALTMPNGDLRVTWFTEDPQYRDYWSKVYYYRHEEDKWTTRESNSIYSSDAKDTPVITSDGKLVYVGASPWAYSSGRVYKFNFLINDKTILNAGFHRDDKAGVSEFRVSLFDVDSRNYNELYTHPCGYGTKMIRLGEDWFAFLKGDYTPWSGDRGLESLALFNIHGQSMDENPPLPEILNEPCILQLNNHRVVISGDRHLWVLSYQPE